MGNKLFWQLSGSDRCRQSGNGRFVCHSGTWISRVWLLPLGMRAGCTCLQCWPRGWGPGMKARWKWLSTSQGERAGETWYLRLASSLCTTEHWALRWGSSISKASYITTFWGDSMYVSVAEKENHSVLPWLVVINKLIVALSYYTFLLTSSDLHKVIRNARVWD